MQKLRRRLISFLMALAVSCGVASVAACSGGSSDNPGTTINSGTGGDSSGTGGDSSGTGGGDVVEQEESIFDGEGTSYVLTENYVLSDKDVEATDGTNKVVVLDYVCTFDLGGKELDLNGYILQIDSEEADCVIEFANGTIKNGTLDISVPNGDIEFDDVTIAENVDYELEAASSTIRFSNATVSGKGTVKSESRVEIEYSNVESITLEGSGSLNAGAGAELGSVEVGENASGASVNISSDATVSEMAISAAANVEIAGEVSSVKVNENVKETEEVSVTVAKTAKVEKVELNAAAKVEVAGEVQNVTVSEKAASGEKAVEVSVSSTAKVQKLDVQAKAEVKVEGEVSNVVVNEKATGTSVSVSGTSASVANIVINSEDVKVESENAETVNKVIVAETVKDKVEVSENVTVETATKEEMEEHLKHEHVYTLKSSKLPTCEENGLATRVCSCGDEYEQVLPAKGHDYSIKITKLPTETEEGVRTHTCLNDGKHTYTESIPALGVKFESFAELIGAWIGEGTYSIVLEEGSSLVLYSDYTRIMGNTSHEDYIFYYTIELAEAVLDVEDGYPTGFMKLVLTGLEVRRDASGDIEDIVISEDDAHHEATVYLYLDGAYVYMEAASDGNIITSFLDSDMIFTGMFGLSADQMLEIIDLAKQAKSYAEMYRPIIEKYLETIADMDVGASVNLEGIFALFEDYFLSVKEAGNGDVAYELDLQKLSKDILDLGKLKGNAAIDKLFGAGLFENLKKEAKDLPDMKIEEIADMAITLVENYDVDVDFVFGAIEALVYEIYNVELDIEAELEKYSDKTLAEIIASNTGVYDEETGEYRTATIEEIKAQYKQVYETVIEYATTYTLDQLFNICAYGDPNFIPNAEEGAKEVFSISTQLKAVVDMYNDATTVTVTLNDGAFKSITLDLEGLVRVEYANHKYQIEVNNNGYTVSITGTVKADTDKVNVTIMNGEEVLYTGDVSLNIEAMTLEGLVKAVDDVLLQIIADINHNDGDHSIDASVQVKDYTFDLEGSEEDGTISAVLKQGENEMFGAQLQVKEGEGATLVISYAGEEIVKIDAIDATIENFKTTVTITVNGESRVVPIAISEIEEGVYQLTMTFPEWVGFSENILYDIKVDLLLSLAETDDAYSCKVDAYLAYEDSEAEPIVWLDGSITLSANKNEDGNVDSLTIEADVDRFLASMGYWYSSDSSGVYERVEYENYATLNGSLTIDLESELVIDKEMAEELVSKYAPFKEMDFRSENSYLTYVKTENGGYYEFCVYYDWVWNYDLEKKGDVYVGWVEYGIYKTTIPAINGIPALSQIYYEEDCNDWYYINLAYYGNMEYQEVRVYGTFTSNYTIVEETSRDIMYSYTGYSGTYLYGYYNVKTKESAKNSQHVYEYSAKLLSGSVYCSDGMKLTTTCANCDYEYTRNYYGCYTVSKQEQTITTSCGTMTVYEYACVCCGKSWTSTSGDYNHSWNKYDSKVLTADDLTALGISAEGFLYGNVNNYHCYYCGLDRAVYSYYTHTEEEGCLRHYYTVYDYAGNEDYAAAKASVSSAEEGHYSYEYSAQLLEGSKYCEDGINVIKSCANCDYESSWTTYGCYTVSKQQVLHTQCGDMTVYEYACVCCGMGSTSTSGNNHSWNNYDGKVLTADDLTALGLSAEGFLYGNVNNYHCYYCGLKRNTYTYYTHTEKEGCLYHTYVVYDYAGNEDYAAANATVSAKEYGHYTSSTWVDFTDALIGEAEALIGGKLTFTATSGNGYQYTCKGCGIVTETYIYLYGANNDYIEIRQYYNDKGEFSSLYYYLYDLDYVVEKAGEYALENANSGYIYVYLNEDKSERSFDLYLYDANNNRVYIYGNSSYWRVEQWDYADCWAVETYIYFDSEGNVTSTEVNEYEKHDYIWTYHVNGDCCTEDGVYDGDKCDSCGKMYRDYDLEYYHPNTSSVWNSSLSGYAYMLTESKKLGAAWISGRYCYTCDKMIDVTIVLQEKWTLQNDVYLYAEGITIDFNGYTLDLNGYNFIVYGFNGSEIVFTDNTYNTADSEANGYSIVDNSEDGDGYLVAFTNGGDVTIGTIALDVNYFFSDTDNRDTIEDSFYESEGETLEGYYDLD